MKAGKLKGLAITTPKRNSAWPDMPTVAEAGLPGYQSLAWYGMVGPRGLPAPVLKKLSDEVARIINSKQVRDNLLAQGADPVGGSPAEFGAFIREYVPESVSVTAAAKKLGVSRQAFSAIINGRAGITADMALRLSKALGTSPELWLGMQMQYDLWHAKQQAPKGVQKLAA